MGGAGDFSYLEMFTFPPPPGFRILLIGAPGVSVVNFPKSDFAADGGVEIFLSLVLIHGWCG